MNDDIFYLIKSYLIKCSECGNLNIFDNIAPCSFCKNIYCKKCKKQSLQEIYGFFKSNYCFECENFFN